MNLRTALQFMKEIYVKHFPVYDEEKEKYIGIIDLRSINYHLVQSELKLSNRKSLVDKAPRKISRDLDVINEEDESAFVSQMNFTKAKKSKMNEIKEQSEYEDKEEQDLNNLVYDDKIDEKKIDNKNSTTASYKSPKQNKQSSISRICNLCFKTKIVPIKDKCISEQF